MTVIVLVFDGFVALIVAVGMTLMTSDSYNQWCDRQRGRQGKVDEADDVYLYGEISPEVVTMWEIGFVRLSPDMPKGVRTGIIIVRLMIGLALLIAVAVAVLIWTAKH